MEVGEWKGPRGRAMPRSGCNIAARIGQGDRCLDPVAKKSERVNYERGRRWHVGMEVELVSGKTAQDRHFPPPDARRDQWPQVANEAGHRTEVSLLFHSPNPSDLDVQARLRAWRSASLSAALP